MAWQKEHETKSNTICDIFPTLWAAPDAQMKQNPTPKVQEGGGAEAISGVGWRARPMEGNRIWTWHGNRGPG